MEDLLSLVLTLQPLEIRGERVEFPRWWGRAAQAALLDVVNQRDQALAAGLHDESTLRPYTVSNLLGRFERKGGAPMAGQTYSLRWSSLTPQLTGLLLAFAETAAGASLELDHVPFRVLAAAIKTEDRPWAGSASYAALGGRYLPGVQVPRRVSFQFTSPVVFKSGGISHPLPAPELVFGSLLEKWNTFAPLAFAPELRRFAAECLAVSRFDLKSRPVPLKDGGLRIGSVGQVTFTATNPDQFWLGQVHTLAAFAQFSGLGAGAAQGLGQARMILAE
jgi:CRISPR-associated endoribonuclease Cas6